MNSSVVAIISSLASRGDAVATSPQCLDRARYGVTGGMGKAEKSMEGTASSKLPSDFGR